MMAALTVVFLTSQFGCLQVAVPSPPSSRIASKVFSAVPRITYCGVTLALVTMVTVVNLTCVYAVTLALVTKVTVVNLTCVQLL